MKLPTMKTSLTINTKKIVSIRTYIDEVDNDFVWKKEIRLFGLTIRKEGFYCCGNYVGKTIKTRNRYVVDKTVMFNPSAGYDEAIERISKHSTNMCRASEYWNKTTENV